jgi:hypothetical protein
MCANCSVDVLEVTNDSVTCSFLWTVPLVNWHGPLAFKETGIIWFLNSSVAECLYFCSFQIPWHLNPVKKYILVVLRDSLKFQCYDYMGYIPNSRKKNITTLMQERLLPLLRWVLCLRLILNWNWIPSVVDSHEIFWNTIPCSINLLVFRKSLLAAM